VDEVAWDLLVRRDDFAQTRFAERPIPAPGSGEALLRVDRVGMTANNVTYALVGESMRYWNFFPTEPEWGRVPLWGFADVVESNVEGVAVGTRVFGYLPTSSHLIVRPEKADDGGFRDGSGHRADLPKAYNVYATTTGDPAYDADREDLQILYRPLFITSFLLDDFLGDNDLFGADNIVMSSASSKTSYGTAFCMGLRETRPRLVGLTSGGNLGFTHKLGCYDEVVSYEDVTSIPADRPTMYVDMAGNPRLRAAVHEHFGDRLVYDAVVGATHLDQSALAEGQAVPGPRPAFFFAPDQIRKRRADWGPGGVEKAHSAAWKRFAPIVEGWVDVIVGDGRIGLRDVWLEVLAGRSDPRAGHVIAL
jgi:hypothetical protein